MRMTYKLLLPLLVGLLWLGLIGPSLAIEGFAPRQVQARSQYGQGVYFLPHTATFYTQPSFEAPVLDQWQWQDRQSPQTLVSQKQHGPISATNRLLAFYPSLSLAMLPVVSDTETGWVQVALDPTGQELAWTPTRSLLPTLTTDQQEPSHAGIFQPWLQFMRLNARVNGVYWLEGVPGYDRGIRQQPDDGAKFVPVTIIRDMRVLHARGNWLLVEVTDLNRSRPIGWVRWRRDDGQLLVFTNFSGERRVVIPNTR